MTEQNGLPEGRSRLGMVTVKVRLDYIDEKGRVNREVWTSEIPVWPAELTAELLALLKARGVPAEAIAEAGLEG